MGLGGGYRTPPNRRDVSEANSFAALQQSYPQPKVIHRRGVFGYLILDKCKICGFRVVVMCHIFPPKVVVMCHTKVVVMCRG